MLKITGMAMIGIPALRSLSVAANKKDHTMSLARKSIERLAAAYTAAWNTGSPQNVAAYFAENGEIVINRGGPWRGRAGIAEMAAGFFTDVSGMKLTCDGIRGAGSHVVYMWTFTGHAAKTGKCPHRARTGRVGCWRRSQG
ncbi:MAG: nuclear transport factor 2 family protein [Pseudomonadota bacterium]|nr:nuclear transport factor 2 family protein [Pseudomonadota bacterium]